MLYEVAGVGAHGLVILLLLERVAVVPSHTHVTQKGNL